MWGGKLSSSRSSILGSMNNFGKWSLESNGLLKEIETLAIFMVLPKELRIDGVTRDAMG